MERTPWRRFIESQLARNPGFESRRGQSLLAEAIHTVITHGGHLVSQAPPGVGKSYACLVPGIHHARATGRPLVVATPSKPLQVQYARKDIPALTEHLGAVRCVTLFGRNNYACLAKLNNKKTVIDPSRLERIRAALPCDGDLVSGAADDLCLTTEERDQLTTSSEECPGAKACPYGTRCYYEQAKRDAQRAQVVVTNTAMLVAAAKIGGERVLPSWSALVVDEAHKLVTTVVDALGWELTAAGARALTATTRRVLGEDYAGLDQLAENVQNILTALTPAQEQGHQVRITETDLFPVHSEVTAAVSALQRAEDDLASSEEKILAEIRQTAEATGERPQEGFGGPCHMPEAERALGRLNTTQRRVIAFQQRLDDIISYRDSDTAVVWLDTARENIKLFYRIVDIAPFLASTVWSQGPAVLLSATIPSGLKHTVGLASAVEFPVSSPFHHHAQTRRYFAAHLTPCTKPHDQAKGVWHKKLSNEITRLILAAGGRSLVLFASYRDLDAVYQNTERLITSNGITLLHQEPDCDRGQLLRQFKDEETSVLYGMASFEEGIDVPGDSLSLVIITRIPNITLDDPVLAKRCELAGGGWQGYRAVNGPIVATRLAQAAGRLIRSRTDTGLLAILDGRVVTTSAGREAIKELPAAPTVFTLTDATTILTQLMGTRAAARRAS